MDAIFHTFLENSLAEVTELAVKSEVLAVTPRPPFPPSVYLCAFCVPYLRRCSGGVVKLAPGPVLTAIHFPEDYLRSTDPKLYLKVASMLTPDFTHPNVRGLGFCLGADFAPGTSISALLWEIYDIVTYQNVTLNEHNSMNPEACRLLRACPDLVAGVERPPFLRRARSARIEVQAV